ncbi:hypothetical protein K493DRAFT_307148 [Basidiobolus meristosporus CBS 931.73]|uniref:BZIP domain-containing protein n=1 Tax=Basidiobolus meristosporus CBS 931.73 TaxID=1314790 RepID=A0A1Y1XJX7_9FUNG|nr:hypothetical protein K493DRAFT_307148 [Basidiobolus meristosporus CBS 931.73]|eukprot:ORX86025.1 hypothetical protein K493DRAFT_307148 [Basidiobolus meristosporus CBS 931.73]
MSQVEKDVSNPFTRSRSDVIAANRPTLSHTDMIPTGPDEFLNPSSKLDQEPNPFEQSFSSVSGTEGPTSSAVTSKSILPSIANIDTPQAPTDMNSWGAQSLRSGPLSPSMLLGPQGSAVSSNRHGFNSYGAQPSPMTAALLGAAAHATPNFLRNLPETTSLQLNSSNVATTAPDKKESTGADASEAAKTRGSMNTYAETAGQHLNPTEKGGQLHSKGARGNREMNGSESHEDGNKARTNRRRSTVSAGSGEGNEESEDEKSGSDKKPDKKSKTENPDEKRKSFLERNRQAALKCRQRKKQWLNNLQAQVEYLSQENETLQNQATGLREEIINLKTLLLAHKNCPIAQANGAMGIEGLVPVMAGPSMAAPSHLGMPPMNVPINMLGMPQVIPGPPPGISQIGVPQHIQGQPAHGVPTNIMFYSILLHRQLSSIGTLPH